MKKGTRFDVFFKFETNPEITVSYRYAIKVTVDGPRPPRSPSNLNFWNFFFLRVNQPN